MVDDQYDLVIFEDERFVNLLPLVYLRPVFDLRCGCLTLRERICGVQGREKPLLYVRDELADLVAEQNNGQVRSQLDQPGRTLFVNGRCFLTEPISFSESNLLGRQGDQIAFIWADPDLAGRLTADVFVDPGKLWQVLGRQRVNETDVTLINYPWDLVHNNIAAILADWQGTFSLQHDICDGRVCPGAHLLAKENICIGPGSVIKPSTVLDAEEGPIIIGSNVTVKSNCTLEGPLFIGDNSLIQPGAVISEGVSIGPVCKVGGELESSIIHSHSNKQHDGFLGHSYIGSWVNLAADTINSDLKNTYGPIRVPINGRDVDSGQMFVGLTMGDHSKTSVGTKFSTGSVVGVACSIFTSRFVPRFLPSFSWLTDKGRDEAICEKVLETAQRVMARRNVVMTENMKKVFENIYHQAQQYEIYPETAVLADGP